MVLYQKQNTGPITRATADRTGMLMNFYSNFSKLEVYKYDCSRQSSKKIDTTDGNLKHREFLTICKHLYGHEKHKTGTNQRFLKASDAVTYIHISYISPINARTITSSSTVCPSFLRQVRFSLLRSIRYCNVCFFICPYFARIFCGQWLRWTSGQHAGRDRGFDPGRSRRIFRAKKSTACLPWVGSKAVSHVADLRGMSKNPGFTGKSESQAKLTGHFSPIIPSFADRGLSCRLHVEAPRGEKAGESNGNLPLRNCLECSVPEPYRSRDWALVPAKTGLRAEY